MNDIASLQQRIQRLEDIEAIKKLTATYALYVNKGWNEKAVDFDKLPLVFSENARWRSAAISVDVSGLANIVEMLKKGTASVDFAMHSFTNPIIEVDGATATGNWLLWVGVKTGNSANEVFQSEEISYVREASGWRIASINLHFGSMLLG